MDFFKQIDEIKSKSQICFVTEDPWVILACSYDYALKTNDRELIDLCKMQFAFGVKKLNVTELIKPFLSVASHYLNSYHARIAMNIIFLMRDSYRDYPLMYKGKKASMVKLAEEVVRLKTEYSIPYSVYSHEFNDYFEFFVEYLTVRSRKKDYNKYYAYSFVKRQYQAVISRYRETSRRFREPEQHS